MRDAHVLSLPCKEYSEKLYPGHKSNPLKVSSIHWGQKERPRLLLLFRLFKEANKNNEQMSNRYSMVTTALTHRTGLEEMAAIFVLFLCLKHLSVKFLVLAGRCPSNGVVNVAVPDTTRSGDIGTATRVRPQ